MTRNHQMTRKQANDDQEQLKDHLKTTRRRGTLYDQQQSEGNRKLSQDPLTH